MKNNQEPIELESRTRQLFVERAEALKRLEKNPDFILVIKEGYLKEKALNSVSLLSNEQIKKAGDRQSVIEELISISNLDQYLYDVYNLGLMIKQDNELEEEEELVGKE